MNMYVVTVVWNSNVTAVISALAPQLLSRWGVSCLTGPLSIFGQCYAVGKCFRSPNYPGFYAGRQSCKITINLAGNHALRVKKFVVGSYSYDDALTVDGVQYVKATGPHGAIVSDASVITWSSGDYGNVGFDICLGGVCAGMPICHVAGF